MAHQAAVQDRDRREGVKHAACGAHVRCEGEQGQSVNKRDAIWSRRGAVLLVIPGVEAANPHVVAPSPFFAVLPAHASCRDTVSIVRELVL